MSLLFTSMLGHAQMIKQFNGHILISKVEYKNQGEFTIKGNFSDPGFNYTANDVNAGDVIIDVMGSSYKIQSLVLNGAEITAETKALESANPQLGEGIIYRPTGKGFPLITQETPGAILVSAINTATISIDNKIPNYDSGTSLPQSSNKIGDVIILSTDSKIYKLTASGWGQVSESGIPMDYSSPVSTAPPGQKGDLIKSYWDNKFYYFDGSSWLPPSENSNLPGLSRFGDVYFDTSQNKLFMFSNGKWLNISGSSTPGGPGTEFPSNTKPGDLYFNTDNNTLYVQDNAKKWVEVSSNGSTPSGTVNPDPSAEYVREGNLFYNTSDHKIYVYNGTAWLPIDLSLRSGQIFMGNSSNLASGVKVSGDATLSAAGRLIIEKLAVTEEKLDKANIPLSGFANPADDVSFGDGASNFKIINLKAPTAPADATTKGYVDALFTTPSLLSLPLNNLFVGNISNKATATAKNMIPISGFDKAIANVAMGSGVAGANFKIINLADPSLAQDAATKNYVDNRVIDPGKLSLPKGNMFVGNDISTATAVAKNTIPLSGFGTAAADIVLGDFKITSLSDPAADQDAATKSYVDKKNIGPANILLTKGNFFVGDLTGKAADVLKNTIPLSGFAAATADISIGGFALNNLAAPLADNDASTKKYVDDLFKTPAARLALPTGNFFVGNATGNAEATAKKVIPVSGFAKATDNIYMGDATTQFGISFLKDPMFDQDAATKKYVDEKIAAPGSLVLEDDHIFVGDASNKAIAVNKNAIPLSDFGNALKDLSIGNGTANFKITNLADPTADQDAVTKKYVDSKTTKTPVGPTAPGTAVAGDTYYNSADNRLYVYSGKDWVPVDNKLNSTELYVGDAKGNAVSTPKTAVPISGFGDALADVSLGNATGNFKITNMAEPTADKDAVTKKYVDTKASRTQIGSTPPATPMAGDLFYNIVEKRLYVFTGKDWAAVEYKLEDGQLFVGNAEGKPVSTPKTAVPLSGFGVPAADISFGNFKLTNLADPATDQEAATKKYVDSKTTKTPVGPTAPGTAVAGDSYYNTADNRLYVYNGKDWVPVDNKLADQNLYVGNASGIAVSTPKNVIPLSGFGSAQADVSMGNFKLTNLVNPTANQDAATKNYVDAGLLSAGANAKDNLGNHKATESIKLSVYAISNDGVDGKGLTFDTQGNASFGQDVTVNGNFYTPSDSRLKTNIETLGNVLQKIDQLRGVKFKYKDQHKYASGAKIGVIAQELQKIYPEMVTTGKDGFLKVDYTQLTGMLIQAVKEQQKQIDELQIRMNNQQEQINSILKKIQ
ncbi:endosialidase-like protein [Pedobacter cryoconitis]|uniref:Endosialidase-like protein n=2 Tax=Pedobacter cryoconitis TaxID=188932 RepID=A0A327SX27_9SPHI|nr:endosialidase-like protein [Pedobacter cryoconitis]